MTQWYHADRQNRRFGPVSAQEIAQGFHDGRLDLDTLVWREGLPQWQALRQMTAELDLLAQPSAVRQGPSAPPPIPTRHAGFARTPVHAPPPRGLSGGMLALIIGAALVLPAIAIIGILAAIALPAYQDYTLRAKFSEVIVSAAPIKARVADFQRRHQQCASNDSDGIGAPESLASRYVAKAVVGTFEDGQCGIELRVRGTGNAQLDGKAVWFEYHADQDTWACSSEIEDRYLPQDCRG